jgi:hypothetical protein
MTKLSFGSSAGIIALAILCVSFILSPTVGQSNQVTIPLLTKKVTLDGMWTTPDEWSDSVEIATSGGFFKLKHDQTYLFIQFSAA